MMKATRLVLLGGVLALSPLMASNVHADAEVSVGVNVASVDQFYEPLGSYGTWVDVGGYGRCWHPAHVDASWRPYCSGSWVYTDNGWYWDSDEQWAWACYHYGRWADDSYYGWVWVPGTEWGPAWVSFRRGGGYVAWAPLSPACVFGPSGEIVIGDNDIPMNWYVSVNVHHFAEPITFGLLQFGNVKIINRTTLITNIRRVNNRVVMQGPKYETIKKYNRVTVRTSTVNELRTHERVPPTLRQPAAVRQETVRPQEAVRPQETQPRVEQQRAEPAERQPAPGRAPEAQPGRDQGDQGRGDQGRGDQGRGDQGQDRQDQGGR